MSSVLRNLISGSEATERSLLKAEERWIGAIKEGIDDAIKRGSFYCYLKGEIPKNIRRELKEKNYKVEILTEYVPGVRRETKTRISWGEGKKK